MSKEKNMSELFSASFLGMAGYRRIEPIVNFQYLYLWRLLAVVCF